MSAAHIHHKKYSRQNSIWFNVSNCWRKPVITEEEFEGVCYKALIWVESLFGPTDPNVEVVGVFVSAELRAPHTAYHPDDHKLIQIWVPPVKETWELSRHVTHEFVHTLTPNGLPGGQATILEEGLAEHSSVYFMRANFTVLGQDGQADHSYWETNVSTYYRAAFQLVEQLVEAEGLEGMREGIRTLRRLHGLPFAKVTADDLETFFTKAPRDLLEALSRLFKDQSD